MFHKKPSLVKTASHDQPQGSSITGAASIPQKPESPDRKKWRVHGIGAPDVQKQKIFLKQLLPNYLQSTLLEGLLEFLVDSLQMIKHCIWIL